MKSCELKLYTNCIPVKGYLRSVIQDVQRGSFSFVPNSLIDCLSESNFIVRDDNVDEVNFNSYREFLVSKDYVFEWEVSLSERFPGYRDVFHLSCHIYSVHFLEVVDLLIVKKVLLLLKQGLIAKHFVFEIGECKLQFLNQLVDLLNDQLKHTTIESVRFRFKKDFGVQDFFLSKSSIDYRINLVEVITLETADSKEIHSDNIQIRFNKEGSQKIVNNFLHYFESIQFHTYFNGKIFINQHGVVSNQPDDFNSKYLIMNLHSKQDVLDIIQLESFNELSRVRKEETVVCKSCELRHMCLDKRLPKQNSEGNWYHSVECDYNPYIGKWKGEDGYKNLELCGVVSNEKEFKVDHEKIKKINMTLWGD